ncbi:hypothetical protein NLJ89_g8668 [Agrocybe chaxingu]|uniref:Uncharacterized protein n=1 Tax=Agrocybe chaxingu TaxID=84603 RepID=A0A9W8JUF7_9AGAR|nr:hypothetical protein NLJ89_g8668 [Agrocybe chaxingu]
MGSFEVTTLGDALLYVPGHHQPSLASLQGKCAFLHLDRVVVLERTGPKSPWDDFLARFRAGNLTAEDMQSLLSRVRPIHCAARTSVIVTANADLGKEWKDIVEGWRVETASEFLVSDHYQDSNLPISHEHCELVDRAPERGHDYPIRPTLHYRLVLRVGDPVRIIGRNGNAPVGALARVRRLPEPHANSSDLLLEFASQHPQLPTFTINMKPKEQLYRVVSEDLIVVRSQYPLEPAWVVDYASIRHHPVNSVLLDFTGTKIFGDRQRSAIYNVLVHAGRLENVQILGPLTAEDLDMKVNRFIIDEEHRLQQLSDSKVYDP